MPDTAPWLPSQPAHNPLDKAVTALGAGMGREGHRGHVTVRFCTPSMAWGVWGETGGWGWEWEEVTVSWRRDSALGRGQCHPTAGHSRATTGTGHRAGTDLSPHGAT